MHDDVRFCLRSLACDRNVGEYREACEPLNIVASLYLVSHELYEEEYEERHDKAYSESTEQYVVAVWRDLSVECRVVNKFTLVSRCSEGDGVLLTFLQEHEIKSGAHFLLSSYLIQDTFLDRALLYLCAILRQLALHGIALNLVVVACLSHGAAYAGREVVELFCQRYHRRRVLVGSSEQSVAFEYDLVVCIDERRGRLVSQSDIRRECLVLVLRQVHIVCDTV